MVVRISELDTTEELDLSTNEADEKKVLNMNSEEIDLSEESGVKEIPKDNNREKVWENPELEVIRPPIIALVPLDILTMMRTIEARLHPSPSEFGAFLKGRFEGNRLIVETDFLLLKQKVTAITIDFLDDPPDDFNGVIHRHPGGCGGFSGVDNESINQNHFFSLLYANNTIKTGIINLELKNDIRLQLELSVQILYPLPENQNLEDIISNIEEEKNSCGYGNPHGLIPFQDGPQLPRIIDVDETEIFDQEDEEEVHDLGCGFTYDGIHCYDPEDTIIDEEDLQEEQKQNYINILSLEEEF